MSRDSAAALPTTIGCCVGSARCYSFHPSHCFWALTSRINTVVSPLIPRSRQDASWTATSAVHIEKLGTCFEHAPQTHGKAAGFMAILASTASLLRKCVAVHIHVVLDSCCHTGYREWLLRLVLDPSCRWVHEIIDTADTVDAAPCSPALAEPASAIERLEFFMA